MARHQLLGAGLIAACAAAAAASSSAVSGCSSSTNTPPGVATAVTTATGMATTMSASSSGAGGMGGMGGAGGMGPMACTTASKASGLRGSAIALTSDDSHLIAVNRDSSSVTVMSIDYSDGEPKMTVVKELQVGGEPWQVAIDGCDNTAYVVLRKDQKVVEITGVSGASPAVGRTVAVGSEPTGIAITPHNQYLYVSNWVDGTLMQIDPVGMTVKNTVDLNAALVATNNLGPNLKARAAMAHPRALAITNSMGMDDSGEHVYVTEWFSVRTGPEGMGGLGADTAQEGLVYEVAVKDGSVQTIALPPITDTGFNAAASPTGKDGVADNSKTGCYPNQLASITIDGGYAYVASTCASPVGPIGAFQPFACGIPTPGMFPLPDAACTGQTKNGASFCKAFPPAGAPNGDAANQTGQTILTCNAACGVDSDCGATAPTGSCINASGVKGSPAPNSWCLPYGTNFKTTTHPALSIITLAAGTATTVNIDQPFASKQSARMPLLQQDIAIKNGQFAYAAAEGGDALFRLTVQNGNVTAVGSANNNFINLHCAGGPAGLDATGFRLPIGVATGNTNKAFAFVNNYGSRDVTAVDLNAQQCAAGNMGMGNDYRITPSTAAPMTDAAKSVLQGRKLFVTGLARWSFKGAAWGSCEACHGDGLTDNVTWYFARGPRQSISLDGTFNKMDPTDQRVLNWGAIFDEVADFELNVRAVSGGVGALVTSEGTLCAADGDCPHNSDCGQTCNMTTKKCNLSLCERINLGAASPPQLGLQGVTHTIADGTTTHTPSVDKGWVAINNYIKTIRSPNKPTNLVAADVAAGKTIFQDPGQGNCVGCHSGAKWTLSKVFWTPSDADNDANNNPTAPNSLSTVTYDMALGGFPPALLPGPASKRFDRFCVNVASGNQAGPGAPCFALGVEQIQCELRPVGTENPGNPPTGVSDPAVGVVEVRADMKTPGQGAAPVGNGFNIPSLLGLQVGAPYFHAGNARTLEELFSASLFKAHFQSPIAQVFSPSSDQVRQLVAYMLSIDSNEPPVAVPQKGQTGGDICIPPGM